VTHDFVIVYVMQAFHLPVHSSASVRRAVNVYKNWFQVGLLNYSQVATCCAVIMSLLVLETTVLDQPTLAKACSAQQQLSAASYPVQTVCADVRLPEQNSTRILVRPDSVCQQ